jgi:hypothetical protein
MTLVTQWIRTRVACYGAAAAIIMEQLNAYPNTTVVETPTPLVRIRERQRLERDWDPDELVTRKSGRRDVLVWEQLDTTSEDTGMTVFSSN